MKIIQGILQYTEQTIIQADKGQLGRAGYAKKQIEGYDTANWILMDYGDIIVHIFDRENRLFYDLERIWRDGKRVDLEEFK